MKAPRVVKSAKIIGEFTASIDFYDGTSCVVDFSKLDLKGAFTKLKTDNNFFNTLVVKHGYVMWEGDLTIDSDFLFEHREKEGGIKVASSYKEKIEKHYKI
jgi:hypothetical protein